MRDGYSFTNPPFLGNDKQIKRRSQRGSQRGTEGKKRNDKKKQDDSHTESESEGGRGNGSECWHTTELQTDYFCLQPEQSTDEFNTNMKRKWVANEAQRR